MKLFGARIPSALLSLVLLDLLVLAVAAALGLVVSYASLADVLDLDGHFALQILVFAALCELSVFLVGLYVPAYLSPLSGVAIRVLVALCVGFVLLTTVFYVIPSIRFWIGSLLAAFLISAIGLTANRVLLVKLARTPVLQRRVLVLGTGPRAARIEQIEHKGGVTWFGCVGFLAIGSTNVSVTRERVLPPTNDLAELCERLMVDEIIVALDEMRGNLPVDMMLKCRLDGVRVTDFASFIEREKGQVEVEGLNPSWLIFSEGYIRGPVEQAVKRLFDFAVSGSLLVLTLPITLMTMLAILIEDGRPIFYRQIRVGQNGRPFEMLKFRSMIADAEKDGVARWASKRDDRVTLVGRFIRLVRIDEIPQVYNVLRGDMSIVGPRPERPAFEDDLKAVVPFYDCRHAVKPGITGWAQINYPYGASVEDAREKLKYDLFYIKNKTLILDLLILLQTFRIVLWPTGAR